MIGALLTGGVTFRRVVGLRHVGLAVAAGALCGVLVFALPSPELVVSVHDKLVTVVGAAVAVPLVAALVAGDRSGGYEALAGVRPISSLALASGRLLGLFMGGLLLALIVSLVGAAIAGQRAVPQALTGVAQESSWRFGLPRGLNGPFELTVSAWLPLVASGELHVDAHRGGEHTELDLPLKPGRRHRVSVPHLDAVGDLYVTLTPGAGVVLGSSPPTLAMPPQTLGIARLAAGRAYVERIAFALIVTLAAACAFQFQTSCLAGLLAFVRPPVSDQVWLVALALLLSFAVFATALIRRQAMP